MKKTISLLLLGLCLFVGDTFAITHSFTDNWVNWPGYTSSLGDEHGTPKVAGLDVEVDGTGVLQSIDILLHGSTQRQAFDSLFINSYNMLTTNSNWDDWDYFVHDGGSRTGVSTGVVPGDGLYTVNAGFAYTLTTTNRVGNPNGIDAGSLTLRDGSFGASHSGYTINYDFSGFDINVSDGFFVAYAPWCANDVMGGGTAPVPEPATMVLLGSGLVGLALYRRKMKK